VKPPLDEGEALEVIRQAGAVPSISQLATMLSWERTSTGRVLARWQAAGLVAVEDGPRGRKIIRALTVVQAEHTCAQPGNTQFEPPAPAPAANAVLHDIAHAPSPLSRTTYFFTEISFAAMIASVARLRRKRITKSFQIG